MDIDRDELRNERLKTPFEQGKSTRRRSKASNDEPPEGGSRTVLMLAVLSLILGGLLAVTAYTMWSQQQKMTRQMEVMNQQIAGLASSANLIADQLETDSERMDSITSDVGVLRTRLGVTTSELKSARALAERLKEEQDRNVAQLTDQIREKADTDKVAQLSEDTEVKFEEVDQQINSVQNDVNASRQEIEKTWQELKTLGLQLTEQGNLIATNSGGIDELRKRGERDYLEFDAWKKRKIKVGEIVVELRKADQKRQRVDMKLFYDDREVEKKKVYTNNPITFYVGRDKVKYEFVINEVRKDQMLGYISVPKGILSTSPSLTNSSD